MWPRRLPSEIRTNPLRSTECRVYERLADSLDGRWVVFYSRPWLGLTPTGEEIDGEADFIIAHPEFGYLTVEVKGGAIRHDPFTGLWTSRDRNGVTHKLRNPVEQARKAKYRVLEALKESPHWQVRRIRIRHGVMLPDTEIPRRDFGLDMPRRMFCDRGEFERDSAGWIAERFSAAEPDEGSSRELGDDGVRALTKILAEPVHFRVPLGHLVANDERELELLTQEQFFILNMFRENPRVVIRGAAGTGKSVLALESARRLAASGERVLLTCYNRSLAARFQRQMPVGPEIRSFHSLCRHFASEAGLAVHNGLPEGDLYEEHLPNLLAQAAEYRPDLLFDAIVVDEGQDIRGHWWIAIEALLRKGGRLQVFHDTNQRFYNSSSALPKDLTAVSILLNRNLRNTRRIHAVVMNHYSGEPVMPNDVEGIPVQFVSVQQSQDIAPRLSTLIRRLIDVERIPPEQIAVLCSTEAECRAFAPNNLIDRWVALSSDEVKEGQVTIDTVRRFKGLEARSIVLVVTRALAERKELAYVASSRAKSQLIIMGDDGACALIAGPAGQGQGSS